MSLKNLGDGKGWYMMFRKLDSKEKQEFVQWARDNWKPNQAPSSAWHPVVVAEWNRISEDYADDWQRVLHSRTL